MIEGRLTRYDSYGGTRKMSPTQIARGIGIAFRGPLGLVGWAIVLSKPILHLLDRIEEMDFINTYWPVVRTFLDTGAGTLVSVAVGTIIIGYSIIHAIHSAPSSPKRDSNPDQPGQMTDARITSSDTETAYHANIAEMSEYDRDRRKREIDELIASITAGKTLQSLKDAGALAWLLQSAIFTL